MFSPYNPSNSSVVEGFFILGISPKPKNINLQIDLKLSDVFETV